MFKTTSQNIQRRVDNAKNKNRIDPSTFKTIDEFNTEADLLGEERAKIQEQIFLLNNKINEARLRAKHTGMFANQSFFEGLQTERKKWVLALREVEAAQTKLKIKRRTFAPRKDTSMTFENIFIKMAKTMLAEEVYMRVFAATAHFIKESEQKLKDDNAA